MIHSLLLCGHSLDADVLSLRLTERWFTKVEIIKAELEEKQFKVKLTVIDTPAFGDYVNNCDSTKSKSSRAELEEKQFKVKLTVIDTPAF
ncbi:uncharacterized protein EDB91DRAFT_323891, partial [Suillus paluster]